MSVLDNPRHEEFAQRVAAGDVSASAAYVGSGYGKRGASQSASRLLHTPKVRARIDELRAAVSARLKKNNIRDINTRLDALQCRCEQMRALMNARAADPAMQVAPGGDTGLLIRRVKRIGRGGGARLIEEFRVDTGLLGMMLANERQAARELGQWDSKHVDSGEPTMLNAALQNSTPVSPSLDVVSPSPWLPNPRHEQFARLVAAGATGKAAYIGAGYRQRGAKQSAYRLLAIPAVQAHVGKLRSEIRERLKDNTIRDPNYRINALQDRWMRMRRLIDARAADAEMQKAPGGSTGLLVRKLQQIGRGDEARIIEDFSVDTGLIRAMLALGKQAAQEVGEWGAKPAKPVRSANKTLTLVERLNAGRQRAHDAGPQ
jgi:phage terminase small subunit